jgi:hypothetical protein
MDKEMLKAAVKEALFESGLAKDMVNISKASKLISRRHIENGIKSGELRVMSAGGKNSNHLIPISDIIEYRDSLLKKGKIK